MPVAEREQLAVALGEVGLAEPIGRVELALPRRHPQRDVVGAARGDAAGPLDHAVDDLLGHPPEGGELAAGDRQQPGRRLVQLGLAGDVDRLARVAGRDQRAHPGVGAGDVGRRRGRCRRSR